MLGRPNRRLPDLDLDLEYKVSVIVEKSLDYCEDSRNLVQSLLDLEGCQMVVVDQQPGIPKDLYTIFVNVYITKYYTECEKFSEYSTKDRKLQTFKGMPEFLGKENSDVLQGKIANTPHVLF